MRRMRRVLRIGAAGLALAGVAAVTAVAPAATPRAASAASTTCARGLAAAEVDPSGLLPLATHPLSHATSVALLFLGRNVVPHGASAQLATSSVEHGLATRFGCGTQVLRRTVVVRIQLCASVPDRVYYVGRFQTGYRVWRVVR